MEDSKNLVLLFDGVCNLCNASVQFIIRRDKKAFFKFAPLQSEFGRKICERNQLNQNEIETVILLAEGKVYTKSAAGLQIVKKLGGLWPLLYVFIIIPAFLRDPVYDFIARSRYKWFGKRDSCMIPDPELRSRFIQD
jgi:predicted DCC family thiol-disulfide oxidoreductase YuxK